MAGPFGLVQESTVTGAADHQAVWVAATSPDLLTTAAGALADPALTGRAVAVDANGALTSLHTGPGVIAAQGGGGGLATDVALVAVASLLLLGLLALELLRPRRARA